MPPPTAELRRGCRIQLQPKQAARGRDGPCGTIPGCVTASASSCQETSPDREMLPLPRDGHGEGTVGVGLGQRGGKKLGKAQRLSSIALPRASGTMIPRAGSHSVTSGELRVGCIHREALLGRSGGASIGKHCWGAVGMHP